MHELTHPIIDRALRAVRALNPCGGLLIFVVDSPDPGWWRHYEDTFDCRGALPEVTR